MGLKIFSSQDGVNKSGHCCKKYFKTIKAIAFLLLFSNSANAKYEQDTLLPLMQSNKILVTVTILGSPYIFVFDTGAEITVLSSDLLKQLQVRKQDTAQLVRDPFQRPIKADVYSVDSLFLNKTCVTNVSAISSDLSTLSSIACKKIDGILGVNAMNKFVWKLETTCLSFSSSNNFDTSNFHVIYYKGNVPEFDIYVCNKKVKAILDTGSDQFLTIGEDDAKDCNFLNLIEGSGYTATTISGANIGTKKRALLNAFRIGDYVVPNVPTAISGTKRLTLLGAGFLNNRTVLLDFTKYKMFIKNNNPTESLDTSYFTSSGITIGHFNGTLKVVFVWNNSIAAKKGIGVGDTVLAIDNIETHNINQEKWCKLKERIEKENRLTLSIKKANTETIQAYSLPVVDLRTLK